MRVAIFNVKHSANLGDGIIAECLEAALARVDVEARSIDLAGRADYGTGLSGAGRSRILTGLDRLPGPLRRGVVRVLLGSLLRLRLRPAWRARLEGCDAVLVGGGQLIADADLNFPLKLSAAAAECRRRRLPVAVFAVGVAPRWSAPGGRLLRRLFARNVAHVAVRDAASRDALGRLLGPEAVPIGLCRDPGLLAADVYPRVPRPARARALVGVGITHPAVLHHHSDAPGAACDAAWYADLVEAHLRAGHDVACFTNGAGEDETCLAAVRANLAARDLPGGGVLTVLPAPRRPTDLARGIAGLDGLVAHRLHAHIVAYAYGIPSVGLAWDGKLAAFLASVGRGDCLATPGRDAPGAIVARVAEALRTGIDATACAAVAAEARRDVARAADALRAAVQARATQVIPPTSPVGAAGWEAGARRA